ncbi:uncharacterized protein LOC126892372 [Diabrotica virgifera virgifera]|uniref:Uncharacterized protein LOC114346706 n=1 Tax=Diabrotica virgifera virgifera TaxID=50390 RepID=A0A6P7GUS0_DIAVI|nr:uncharacterized protein LOC126892372 [Diabrotica virgifera virgifera]
MSSILDHRYEYLNNKYFRKHEYGDFTPFYITITICSILALTIFLINLFLGCCSRHSEYWQDRYTGNRWIVSLWTSTPHQQPSLDYTELQHVQIENQGPRVVYYPPEEPQLASTSQKPPPQYLELQKRESDI